MAGRLSGQCSPEGYRPDFNLTENLGSAYMNYTGVGDDTPTKSTKWGVRWLYRKKSSWSFNQQTNKVYDPTWKSWSQAVADYGTGASYSEKVFKLKDYGINPHEGAPTYLWPILSNGKHRP